MLSMKMKIAFVLIGLACVLQYQNCEARALDDHLKEVGDSIKKVGDDVADSFDSNVKKPLEDNVDEANKSFSDKFNGFLDKASDLASQAKKSASNAFDSAKESASNAFDSAKKSVSSAYDDIKHKIES
ncbi:uncharacterized protein LOC123301633 [Chrysoperla carnea]|uniref:uncharacterized protein LOC123301633 n=1 Tax=Chrysoperla carnea TaxID=189513 RepID=UPI001D06AE49|nr:uncharacterized protein LOC123301633 [Chrysoperla carnea]